MKKWQLQEAKAKLSMLVKEAQQEAQWITVHGNPEAVLLSKREYERLAATRQSLFARLQSSPLKGLELKTPRDKSPTREIKL